MHYAYRFRLKPTTDQRELLDYHRNTCRQLYNHALGEFNEIPESDGTLNHATLCCDPELEGATFPE